MMPNRTLSFLCLLLALPCAAIDDLFNNHDDSSEDFTNTGIGGGGSTKKDKGWNILQKDFMTGNPALDGLAFEWEYFMIHDKSNRFSGLVGYVISDPEGLQQGFAPSGGNVLFSGLVGNKTFSSFQSFGLTNWTNAKNSRRFEGGSRTAVDYARLTPADNGKSFLLEGQDENYAYKFFVSRAWFKRSKPKKWLQDGAFTPVTALDIGGPGESWTVDSVWPRSRVEGWLIDLKTNETIPVNGHGYRENAYGRWAFVFGGWDFMVMSDTDTKVQFVVQSYCSTPRQNAPTTPSTALDFIDVSFDRVNRFGERRRVAQRLRNITLVHPTWEFHAPSNQCRPLTSFVTAENDKWKVNATWGYENRQQAILSDMSVATRAYVIQEHFPIVSGFIYKKKNNGEEVLVDTFNGIAGGEFAVARSLTRSALTLDECVVFGATVGAL